MSQTDADDGIDPPGPAACFHGGASFGAIGAGLDRLDRRHEVIAADVLDAWFDPAPAVLDALREHLPWLVRSSPPTQAEGLISRVAATRGLPEDCLVVGAGSSDLIFRALPDGLGPSSRALVLDPSYGEYAHVLQSIVGCRVDRLVLRRDEGFDLDPTRLEAALHAGYDLVVLVNPNNPTGRHVPRRALGPILEGTPARTRVWVDEAYVDYAGPGESVEDLACRRENLVACKSLSKALALSGLRVAYLATGPAAAARLRARTPPWAVGLPAQVAAVRALGEPAYYAERYRQTHALRAALAEGLRQIAGVEVVAGVLNAVLCLLPRSGPDAATVAARCRRRGLFVRDCGPTAPSLGRHALRVAVKDAAAQERMVALIKEALAEGSA